MSKKLQERCRVPTRKPGCNRRHFPSEADFSLRYSIGASLVILGCPLITLSTVVAALSWGWEYGVWGVCAFLLCFVVAFWLVEGS